MSCDKGRLLVVPPFFIIDGSIRLFRPNAQCFSSDKKSTFHKWKMPATKWSLSIQQMWYLPPVTWRPRPGLLRFHLASHKPIPQRLPYRITPSRLSEKFVPKVLFLLTDFVYLFAEYLVNTLSSSVIFCIFFTYSQNSFIIKIWNQNCAMICQTMLKYRYNQRL